MHRPAAIAFLLLSSAPALAAPRDNVDAGIARTADRLNDPRMQSAISGMVIAAADMMMDLRIDRLRDAIARIDPDARDNGDEARTLGDVIVRDDPYFRDRLASSSRRATQAAGAMAGTVADMVPDLRAMNERISRDVEKLLKTLPRD